MSDINQIMAMMQRLNQPVQQGYNQLEQIAAAPPQRGLLNAGQSGADFFLNPTQDQNRVLLEAGSAMLGSDPRAHPGKGISDGIRAGLSLHDEIKSRDKTTDYATAQLGLQKAIDARDYGMAVQKAMPGESAAYEGTGIEAQHLNNWMRYENGELSKDDPKVKLAKDYLTRPKTITTPDGTHVIPGYNIGGQGQSQGGGFTEKRRTEGERKADFVNSNLKDMNDKALSVIEDKDGGVKFSPSMTDRLSENLGPLKGYIQSPEYKQYRSAADEWATLMVFLRSGATARQEEKDSAFDNYWPQPGDDDETIQFKTKMRESAMINASKLGREKGRIDAAEVDQGGQLSPEEMRELEALRSKHGR